MDLQEKLTHQKAVLAKATEKLNQFYQTTFTSEKLQILRPLLKWEATLATAANIESGLVPFFLGLKQLFIGENDPKNPSKLIGPHLKLIVDSLTKNLTQFVWEPKISDSNKDFFKEFITFSIMISACGGILLSKKEKLSEKKEEIHHLSYQLNLLILANSTILTRIYKSFLKLCGANAQAQQSIAEILSLGSWFLMILVVIDQNPKEVSPLIETLKSPAIKMLDHVEQILSKIDQEHESIIIFIQQCKKSFEEENINGIIESMEGIMEFIGTSLNHVKEELGVFYKMTELLENTLTHGMDDKTNKTTSISVVV